jgi:hypothetical protein
MSQEAPKKRPKKHGKCNESKSKQNPRTWSLDMLVGSLEAVGDMINHNAVSSEKGAVTYSTTFTLQSILAKYNMTADHLVLKSLPGRPAETKKELQQWNTDLWPTLFFEKKTDQFKEAELLLSNEDISLMMKGMQAAVQDAIAGQQQWKDYESSLICKDENRKLDSLSSSDISGVIVLDPQTGSIVSAAADERQLQAETVATQEADSVCLNSFPDNINPLCTSTILAIQGVSRIERGNAVGHGMESKEFQRGQVSDLFSCLTILFTVQVD